MENNRIATSRIATNPWTNKAKTRGEGLLNSIMNKYLNDQDIQQTQVQVLSEEEKKYIEIANKIKNKYKVTNQIDDNLTELFELKKRCNRIDEILEWIEKIEQRSKPKQQQGSKDKENTDKEQPKTVPIDSSFIYLPLYSGTIFHEILKDCSAKDKRKNIGEYRNPKLKQALDQIKNIQDLNKLLEKNIL